MLYPWPVEYKARVSASLAAAMVLFVAAGCFRGNSQRAAVPVHWDRDRDEFCGMVVSDRRFAAQAVEPDGKVHVFDDIGCLVQWLDDQTWRDQARIWVRDRNADRWIDPERAQWRRGELTPSGYGFGASLESGYGALNFSEIRDEVLARRGQPEPTPSSSRPPSVRP